jgi:hypothetical protein
MEASSTTINELITTITRIAHRFGFGPTRDGATGIVSFASPRASAACSISFSFAAARRSTAESFVNRLLLVAPA